MRLSLILLASLAWGADIPLGVEHRRGEFAVRLDKYSVPALAASQARSLAFGEADYTAKSPLRGDGVVVNWRGPSAVIGAVVEVVIRRGAETVRASEYCQAPLYIGGYAACYVRVGSFDAVTDIKLYPAILSRAPVSFQ